MKLGSSETPWWTERDGTDDPIIMPPPSEEWQQKHGWQDGKPPPDPENGRRSGLFEKEDDKDERDANLAQHLTITDEPWDEDGLKPRPWLGPPYMMRRQITLLHGPGGAGKSTLIIVWAIALALGMAFGRLKPKGRCRVLLGNFEEDDEEQTKRISAALRLFGRAPADLKGWLYRVSLGPKAEATMFELDQNGQVRGTECWQALEYASEKYRPDAVALDPFVAINAVPENNNQLMRRVMTMMKIGLAQRFDCAVLLAHHDNKSGDDSEDSDQSNARGGGDIVNAVRFELAVKKMSAGQADAMGVHLDKRGYYFRVGSAASKMNYVEPQDSEWFERLTRVIAGEKAVFCLPWKPPTGKLDDAMAASLVATIGKGTSNGPYSPQLGKGSRSLSLVLSALGIAAPTAQRRALEELKARHGVEQSPWNPPGKGADTRQGLRTAARLPSNWRWQDAEDDADA
jgi:hypothetical protein